MARIVVFDTVTDSSRLLERLLEAAGHKVVACSNRAEVLQSIDIEAPDLLVARVRAHVRESMHAAPLFEEITGRLKILAIADHPADCQDLCRDADVLIDPAHIDNIQARVQELIGAQG